MGLDELNEKLHGREVHLDRIQHGSAFDPGKGTSDPKVEAQFEKKEEWHEPIAKPPSVQEITFADISKRKRRRRIALVLGGIALLMLLGGLIYKVRAMLFSEERIEIAITGPQDVASAEETTFTVFYANDNWAGLNNVTLVLSYPESFHPEGRKDGEKQGQSFEISLGSIPASTKGKTLVTGKFYGSRGDLAYLNATLRYTPKGVSTIFEKTARFGVNVATSPLDLEVTAPLELASGQDVEYVIDYGNRSDLKFSNVRVKAEYPEGFQFVSAEPRASEGESVWYIGNLNAQAEGKIIIRGVLAGKNDEYKSIRAMIGFFQGDGKFVAYAENERQMRISASPFFIEQTVNGLTNIAVNPGDLLRYSIKYKNESNIGMRDVIITVEINPMLLDTSRLATGGGAYDAARKIIVWKASDVPSLRRIEPGESGEISFTVPVLETVTGGEKNNIIRSVAKIDSPDVPTTLGANKIIGSNTLLVKLHSLVGVDVQALYTNSFFPNSGPFPPQVGKETSYTLLLQVMNSSNDLKQTRLFVLLPTGVKYTGKFSSESETVNFNERTNELTWELGTLAPVRETPRTLAFQVSAVPSSSNVEHPLILINSTALTAVDAFTNQEIRVEKGETNSWLRYDETYANISGNVINAP